MPMKRSSRGRGPEILRPSRRSVRPTNRRGTSSVSSVNAMLRSNMQVQNRAQTRAQTRANANGYLCAIERNQNGKYNVRVRATFAPAAPESNGTRSISASAEPWTLPVYFLASSFNGAMKKLEESLQLLQKNEDRLRFWGVERTDDPNMAGDMLQDFGLRLDRRRDFPRKAAELGVPRERAVPAAMLAPVRRILADSVAQERPVERALAGD